MPTATETHNPPHLAPTQRGRRGWIILCIVAAIAVIAAWFYHAKGGKSGTATDADGAGAGGQQASEEPITVATIRLEKGGIMRICSQIGSVHPFKEADLYAKVSGYLKELHVDYGDHVKQDQLLAEIDDPEVVKEAEKAEADVEQARAAVGQTEAMVESAKADRDASASAVEQAVAEVERFKSMTSYHQKKYARYQELVQSKAIPQQIADEEEENYESSRASELASQKAVLNSRAQLIASGARITKAEADVSEARANVRVAEAKLETARVLVGYTRITSPYEGVITKRNLFPGAFIRSAAEGGTVPLLNVARIDKVRVITEIPDRDVPVADVGDPAEITLDALGSEVFRGKISRFADAEDPSSRTMHTEVDLPNPDGRLRPGMYGIARIILDQSTKNATLPSSCIVGESKGGKADLYVIKDGKVKDVKVDVGADDGLRIEVLSGLDLNDDVILDPGSVTEGTPVRADRGVSEAGKSTSK